MTYPPVYILRQGQAVWNAERRIQGNLDSPLTDLGKAQARKQHAIRSGRDLGG
ncbi:MAG: histidine phosphatase family protein [Roseobacter sp.]